MESLHEPENLLDASGESLARHIRRPRSTDTNPPWTSRDARLWKPTKPVAQERRNPPQHRCESFPPFAEQPPRMDFPVAVTVAQDINIRQEADEKRRTADIDKK